MADDVNPMARAMSDAIAVDHAYRALLDANGQLRDRDWGRRWREVEAHAQELGPTDWLALYRASREIPDDDKRSEIGLAVIERICSMDGRKLPASSYYEIIESMDGHPTGPFSFLDSDLADLALTIPGLDAEDVDNLCYIKANALGYDFHDQSMEFESVINHPRVAPLTLTTLFANGSKEAGERLYELAPDMAVDDIKRCKSVIDQELWQSRVEKMDVKLAERIWVRWLSNPYLIDDLETWGEIKDSLNVEFNGRYRDISIRAALHELLQYSGNGNVDQLQGRSWGAQPDPGVERRVFESTHRAEWTDPNGVAHPLVCGEGALRCDVHDSPISRRMQVMASGQPKCREVIGAWNTALIEPVRDLLPSSSDDRENPLWIELNLPIGTIRRVLHADFTNALGIPVRTGEDLLQAAPEWLWSPGLAMNWLRENLTPWERGEIEYVTGLSLSPLEIDLL